MPTKHPAHESQTHENTVASEISAPNLPSHDNKILLKHPASSKAPNAVLIAGSEGSLSECPSNVEHLQSNKQNTYGLVIQWFHDYHLVVWIIPTHQGTMCRDGMVLSISSTVSHWAARLRAQELVASRKILNYIYFNYINNLK